MRQHLADRRADRLLRRGLRLRRRDACATPSSRPQGPGQIRLRKDQAERREDHGPHGAEGRVLFCSPVRPGSCADITQARQLGLAQLLADGPFMEILADAGYQGMGAQTGGRVVTPPHRKFKKNAPAWYEERHEQQRKAHCSRRIRVEHGIAHLKNWRALARHEHMSDIVHAVAGLLSHQQTATLSRGLQA
ncbi:transposase family protein [Streptomyces sp. NPDC053069]|uniref:transposase family protein n=1 Tax=Streptomyces sp. NPDC053069 TaxID=3365695 RepID=UPI0037CFA053